MTNVAFTTALKEKNPYTGEWDDRYLVPAYECQAGQLLGHEYNLIYVCCSPKFNGVYRYPSNLTETYDKWMNNKKCCLYVDRFDCEKVAELKDLKKPETIRMVASLQDKWYKGEIKNHPEYKREKKPTWMTEWRETEAAKAALKKESK